MANTWSKCVHSLGWNPGFEWCGFPQSAEADWMWSQSIRRGRLGAFPTTRPRIASGATHIKALPGFLCILSYTHFYRTKSFHVLPWRENNKTKSFHAFRSRGMDKTKSFGSFSKLGARKTRKFLPFCHLTVRIIRLFYGYYYPGSNKMTSFPQIPWIFGSRMKQIG